MSRQTIQTDRPIYRQVSFTRTPPRRQHNMSEEKKSSKRRRMHHRRDRRDEAVCIACAQVMTVRCAKEHKRAGVCGQLGIPDVYANFSLGAEGDGDYPLGGAGGGDYPLGGAGGGDSSAGPSGDEVPIPITVSGRVMGFMLALRAWQTAFGISRRAIVMLLTVIGLVFPPVMRVTYYIYEKLCQLPQGGGFSDFSQYTQCNSCYDLSDVQRDLGDVTPPLCQKTRIFRNNTICGTRLYDRVKCASSRKSKSGFELRPRLIATIRKIKTALGDTVSRPGMWACLDAWRVGRQVEAHVGVRGRAFADVYDGDMWKSFMEYADAPYLNTTGNLCLSLNLDWFQPFSDTPYSCGAMYLAIMNLPPHLRYKRENCIVLASFPPSTKSDRKESQSWNHLNPMLEIIVAELQTLYTGIDVQVRRGAGVRRLRAIVIMFACDQPAQRKLCGFMGSGTVRSCWRCPKEFVLRAGSGSGDVDSDADDERSPDDDLEEVEEKKNPRAGSGSGDVDSDAESDDDLEDVGESKKNPGPPKLMVDDLPEEGWGPTPSWAVRLDAAWKFKASVTIKAAHALARESGIRWSAVMRLCYIDAGRMAVIDPMHCLYGGVGKRLLKLLIKIGLLPKPVLRRLQIEMDDIDVPRRVGKTRRKIQAKMGGMTCAQLKNQ